MKVESIAEYFTWSIQQYFWRDNWSWINFWSFWEFYTGSTLHKFSYSNTKEFVIKAIDEGYDEQESPLLACLTWYTF